MAQFSQFQFRVFPCHPREQFQCLNTVLTNITGPLILEFTRCAKAIFSRFKKIASSVTNGNFLIFSGKRSRFLPFPASVHLSLFFFLKFLPETLVTYRTIISQSKAKWTFILIWPLLFCVSSTWIIWRISAKIQNCNPLFPLWLNQRVVIV